MFAVADHAVLREILSELRVPGELIHNTNVHLAS